jgi:nucleoid DNA-binding protein
MQQKVLKQVSEEFNLSSKEVETLYKLWWKKAKEIIESDNMLDINIPNLGKLIINQTKKKYIDEIKKDKTDV